MEPFVKNITNNGRPEFFELKPWTSQFNTLKAGFSTRNGGVSIGEWNSLNCALHVNDLPQNVVRNRQLLTDAIGVSFAGWTCAEQVHGNEVYVVSKQDRGKGRFSSADAIPSKDGLITNVPGICLTSFYADCVPLYFFDPVHQVIGLAHAGWKGTVSSIALELVHKMHRTFGSQPKQLKAAIGPAIGRCCYEVDDAVIQHFEAAHITYGITPKINKRFWLDLKEINRQIMIKAGIMASNIELSNLCTACHTDVFFSHRAEEGKTGRMISWIGLN